MTLVVNCYFAYKSGSIYIISRKENEVHGISSEMRRQLAIALAGAIICALIIGLAGLWAGLYVHH